VWKEGQIKILKERKQEKGTHNLLRTNAGTNQNSKRMKKCNLEALTSYYVWREGKSEHRNEIK
jgi:hypothetical protein